MARYEIAGENFSNQDELAVRAKAILHRLPRNVPLQGQDFLFVHGLLERHPRAEKKIGVGVKRLWVGTVLFGAPGFYLMRMDGSTTEFSYKKCVSPNTAPYRDLIRAFRDSVDDKVEEARRNALVNDASAICPFTHEDMRLPGNCHIDHAPPWTFRAIVSHFMRQGKLTVDDIHLHGHGDGEMIRHLSLEMNREWRFFHSERAVLRAVSRRANCEIIPQMIRDNAVEEY